MFFVHPFAIIKNHGVLPPPPLCPKKLKSHLSNEKYCLGHSYQVAPANAEGKRKIGDTVYDVKPVTPDTPLEFPPGIFLRLPITDIDHVVYKDGKPDPRVKEKAAEVKIPLNYTLE